ncbi:hypothetical protein CLV97_102146 [Planifilum fimeticola]|uniref:Uncharacterized protein n=1 Tax=Planifilum fimeticola TaxID=201975 RepID=A0A2T0LIT4_9BACL|nr:hypothetical protein [Planifilum fimeticola]PRX42357.1 hypothetical protein CLV97_102146 [Planifilum fimeticola]
MIPYITRENPTFMVGFLEQGKRGRDKEFMAKATKRSLLRTCRWGMFFLLGVMIPSNPVFGKSGYYLHSSNDSSENDFDLLSGTSRTGAIGHLEGKDVVLDGLTVSALNAWNKGYE